MTRSWRLKKKPSVLTISSRISPLAKKSRRQRSRRSPVSDGGGEEAVSMPEVSKDPKSEDNASVPSSKETTNGLGGVAEFRKTLANLSEKLEIDRLAFLHKSLEDRGEALPTLEQIAGDIHGIKPMSPTGIAITTASVPRLVSKVGFPVSPLGQTVEPRSSANKSFPPIRSLE